jgi:hypothetical protein
LDNLVTAAGLCGKEGPIGPTEETFRSVAGLKFGDAEACGDVFVAQTRMRELGETEADLLCSLGGRSVIALRAQKNELFSSISAGEVARPGCRSQQGTEGSNDLVARLVPVNIVNLLEVVQVANYQTAGQSLLLMLGNEDR